MVGVPGKSKGCNTCRKRKIACSLERPECLKCVRTNRKCGGYQRDAIFVVDQATGESAAELPPKSHIKTYRRPVASPRKTKGAPESSQRRSGNGQGQGPVNLSAAAATFAPDIEISSPAAFRQQFFCQFLSTFVPDADQAAVRLKAKTEDSAWLVLIPELPEVTKALDTAILALSTARVGRNNRDHGLVIESRKMYGEGLRDLQRALYDPQLMYRDETLAACMALGIYETMECPAEGRGGWVSHSDGCAKLVQLRGPRAHSSSLGHYLFTSFRLTGIIQGIHHRRATYLSQPEWTKIAWKGRSNGSFDHLLDLTSKLPGIFEDSDDLGQPQPQEMPALFDVLDRCWKLDAELAQFYEALEASTDGPLYWSRLSTLEFLKEEGDFEKVFPVAFHFNDLSSASTTNMYWMTCLLCWRTIMEISMRIMRFAPPSPPSIKTESPSPVNSIPSSPSPLLSKLRPLGHRKDLIILAKNICQTVEFCIQDDKRSQGPGALLLPLLVATLTFRFSPNCERQLAWSRAAMGRLADKGWRISTHLEPEGKGYTKKKPED